MDRVSHSAREVPKWTSLRGARHWRLLGIHAPKPKPYANKDAYESAETSMWYAALRPHQ